MVFGVKGQQKLWSILSSQFIPINKTAIVLMSQIKLLKGSHFRSASLGDIVFML